MGPSLLHGFPHVHPQLMGRWFHGRALVAAQGSSVADLQSETVELVLMVLPLSLLEGQVTCGICKCYWSAGDTCWSC